MKLLLILFSFCSMSCATLLNSEYSRTTIHTYKPSKVYVGLKEITTKNNKAKVSIKREKDPATLTIVTDSIEKDITLSSHSSFAFYSNIVLNDGIGLLIDWYNPKRYTYPSKIFIDSTDISKYYRYNPDNKGDLLLHISLPHINTFLMKPDFESAKSTLGFWGISLGVDYYYKKKHFCKCFGISHQRLFLRYRFT